MKLSPQKVLPPRAHNQGPLDVKFLHPLIIIFMSAVHAGALNQGPDNHQQPIALTGFHFDLPPTSTLSKPNTRKATGQWKGPTKLERYMQCLVGHFRISHAIPGGMLQNSRSHLMKNLKSHSTVYVNVCNKIINIINYDGSITAAFCLW